MSLLAAVCLLTFLHYVGAQMRGPILPLYAAAHGATATGVGFIVAAHMTVAAAGSIPLGRASDVLGRRPLLIGGMVVTGVTSLLLPLFESELALLTIYGLAGFGVAAFTPSALSLVSDGAASGRAGYAFAWYTTAHYGAIAVGPGAVWVRSRVGKDAPEPESDRSGPISRRHGRLVCARRICRPGLRNMARAPVGTVMPKGCLSGAKSYCRIAFLTT